MDFFTSSILGGIIYDLIKRGIQLTVQNVFGGIYGTNLRDEICEEFIGEINQVHNTSEKSLYARELLEKENRYTIAFERDMYKTNFAKRLDYIIHLINDSEKMGNKTNIEHLGEYLGFASSNELKKFYLYDSEPTYEFCDGISKALNINPAWLKAGTIRNEHPFTSELPRLNNATSVLDYDEGNKVCEYYFGMLDNIERRSLIIVRKFDEFKYDFFPRQFVFHNNVGCSGRRELLSVYRFLKKMDDQGKTLIACLMSESSFNELLRGKIYPGSILKYKTDINILHDFLDLKHSFPIKDNYELWYGKNFIECQRLVSQELEENEQR